MRQDISTETIDAPVRGILAFLDGSWKFESSFDFNRWNATATRDHDGMQVRFTIFQDDTSRIRAHAIYPDDTRGGESFDASASLSRDSQAIARDIQRKIVAPFEPARADALARKADGDARRLAAEQLSTDLQARIGSASTNYLRYNATTDPSRPMWDQVSVEFKVEPDARTKVIFDHLNPQQVRALADVALVMFPAGSGK